MRAEMKVFAAWVIIINVAFPVLVLIAAAVSVSQLASVRSQEIFVKQVFIILVVMVLFMKSILQIRLQEHVIVSVIVMTLSQVLKDAKRTAAPNAKAMRIVII